MMKSIYSDPSICKDNHVSQQYAPRQVETLMKSNCYPNKNCINVKHLNSGTKC